ncbi:MAG TPA: hypothetical protein VGI52_09265, partial [Solirubrobacteraceae bacterium]
YLGQGFFQPTIASAFGAGRGWGGIWPFLLAAGLGVALAMSATARMRLTLRSLGAGALALLAWGLFAAIAPTKLGIDHQGLLSIVGAGDHTALNLKLHDGSRYPLDKLVVIAGIAGMLALGAARLLRNDLSPPTEPAGQPEDAFARPAATGAPSAPVSPAVSGY